MSIKPKAYIVSEWQTGMGDGYVNILNSYYTMKDLESIGYDVIFIKNINRNIYFNSLDPKLFCEIFDLSPFGEKVLFNNFEMASELEKTHIQLDLICKSYKIFVEKKLVGIDDYQIKLATINDSENIKNKKYDFIMRYPQFLNKNIILAMEEFLSFTDYDLSGISFRIPDEDLQRTDILYSTKYESTIDFVKSFLKNCSSKHIFLSSSNIYGMFFEELKKLDDRLFSFSFTNKFPMHYPLTANGYYDNLDNFLQHAKEIAINMASFSKCKDIFQVCGSPSSFMVYGFYHNIHNSLPSDRSLYSRF
jgi:hypothetical protein